MEGGETLLPDWVFLATLHTRAVAKIKWWGCSFPDPP